MSRKYQPKNKELAKVKVIFSTNFNNHYISNLISMCFKKKNSLSQIEIRSKNFLFL